MLENPRDARTVSGPPPAPDDDLLVLGFLDHSGGNITALNIDAGLDISAYPAQLVAAEELCVTAGGAGELTVFFISNPIDGYATFDT